MICWKLWGLSKICKGPQRPQRSAKAAKVAKVAKAAKVQNFSRFFKYLIFFWNFTATKILDFLRKISISRPQRSAKVKNVSTFLDFRPQRCIFSFIFRPKFYQNFLNFRPQRSAKVKNFSTFDLCGPLQILDKICKGRKGPQRSKIFWHFLILGRKGANFHLFLGRKGLNLIKIFLIFRPQRSAKVKNFSTFDLCGPLQILDKICKGPKIFDIFWF